MCDGIRQARPRRPRSQLRDVIVGALLAAARTFVEFDRQHFGDGRAGPSALGERSTSAEHQQATAAFAHEIGEHPQLIGRKRRRLDAAENDRPVREELLSRLGKSADDLVGAFHIEAEVLVFRRALQDGDRQILVVSHGAANELGFESRFAFHVQDPLATVPHFHQRVARVVLRHLLAGLRLDAHFEQPRSGVRCREVDAHRRRLTVGRHRDVLRADDAALVFDVEWHGGARVSGLRNDDIDRQRRALERGPRRLDAGDLNVAVKVFLANADRKYGNRSRLQAGQRFVQRCVRRVGAVGDHDEAGQRQPRELVARAFERLAEVGRRARILQVSGVAEAVG